jgi:hypothetical protein
MTKDPINPNYPVVRAKDLHVRPIPIGTKLTRHITSGAPLPLAPPPPRPIDEYAQWAALFGIPFKARTPHQLEESLRRVKEVALIQGEPNV